MESFAQWVERQYSYAATAMLKSVSRVDLVKTRPGFGQAVRPAKGSIIASPVLASYDPDPDYFFHWYRDSAVVIDALRLLFEAGVAAPGALDQLADFTRFSLSLHKLDGRSLVTNAAWRSNVVPGFVQYVRDEADLASARGETVVADTRVNPDGTLDISRWARPQHDGPPLRALAMMRWARSVKLEAGLAAEISELIHADLAFTYKHWREPSFDIWEEEQGEHYYTLSVAAAALEAGADWLRDDTKARDEAASYRADAALIRRKLDGFWMPAAGHYASRVLTSGARSTKELDIAVILAAIHTGNHSNAHSVHDPRMHATLARLEELFVEAYPINRNRSAGPAMGRYAGDVYYSGGAYYFSTLGAAEFCFRAAAGSEAAAAWIKRGDAYLATVQTFTPASGELSEQFDQRTGEQTSAKHLAWSYAGFISCVAARRAVVGN